MVNKKNISTSRSNTRKRKHILYDNHNEFMNRDQISPMVEYNILSNSSISPESHVQSVFEKRTSSPYLSESEYVDNESDSDEREDRENIGNENKIESDDLSYASITSKNDMKIYRMKCLLDEKRKSIIKKNKEIKELSKQNAYLESIITDYDKLNTNNLDEKQKQKKALKILSEHIRHISKDLKKDEHEIYRVKNDQKMVMAEIEKLRDDISDILHAIDIPGNLYASSDSDSYNSE
jgi:hypothetical protein